MSLRTTTHKRRKGCSFVVEFLVKFAAITSRIQECLVSLSSALVASFVHSIWSVALYIILCFLDQFKIYDDNCRLEYHVLFSFLHGRRLSEQEGKIHSIHIFSYYTILKIPKEPTAVELAPRGDVL